MSVPDFIIIGAAKCGTTALYNILGGHPDISMSIIKETNYFAFKDKEYYNNLYITSDNKEEDKWNSSRPIIYESDYLKLFKTDNKEKLFGEASPIYLYSKSACNNIYKYKPTMKLIVILRDPIKRAISHLTYRAISVYPIKTNFNKLLNDFTMSAIYNLPISNELYRLVYSKDIALKSPWYTYGPYSFFLEAGLYYKQLKKYYNNFPEENIKIIIYEEFVKNKHEILIDIFDFLKIKSVSMQNIMKNYNPSGIPKINILHKITNESWAGKKSIKRLISEETKNRILNRIQKRNYTKPRLTIDNKKLLKEYYMQDIENLRNLINHTLPDWLKIND